MYWTSKQNELKHLKYVTDNIKDKCFAEVINYHMQWYIRMAIRTKRIFYFLSIMNILLPLLLEGINLIYGQSFSHITKIFILVIPLVISFISSLLTFGRFYDKWVNYRSTITKINVLLNEYTVAQNSDDCDSMEEYFYKKLNDIILDEGNNWILITKDNIES